MWTSPFNTECGVYQCLSKEGGGLAESKQGGSKGVRAVLLPRKLEKISGLRDSPNKREAPVLLPVNVSKREPCPAPLLYRRISVEGRESSAHILLNPSTIAEKEGARTFRYKNR